MPPPIIPLGFQLEPSSYRRFPCVDLVLSNPSSGEIWFSYRVLSKDGPIHKTDSSAVPAQLFSSRGGIDAAHRHFQTRIHGNKPPNNEPHRTWHRAKPHGVQIKSIRQLTEGRTVRVLFGWLVTGVMP